MMRSLFLQHTNYVIKFVIKCSRVFYYSLNQSNPTSDVCDCGSIDYSVHLSMYHARAVIHIITTDTGAS